MKHFSAVQSRQLLQSHFGCPSCRRSPTQRGNDRQKLNEKKQKLYREKKIKKKTYYSINNKKIRVVGKLAKKELKQRNRKTLEKKPNDVKKTK